MHPINILIQKKKFFPSTFSRWYSQRKIILDVDSGPIRTEAQFCHYLLLNFGVGYFMCIATRKGKKGFWLFWKGTLDMNGFIRDKKVSTYLHNLEVSPEELGLNPQDFRTERAYENEYNIRKDEFIEDKINKRRRIRSGPLGLRPSQPISHKHDYQEHRRENYGKYLTWSRENDELYYYGNESATEISKSEIVE